MKHLALALVAPLILLTACLQAPPVDQNMPDTAAAGTCAADRYQGLITQSEVALATMSFPGTVRVIHPNEAVTMDYNPERMNILIDDAGRISRVNCG